MFVVGYFNDTANHTCEETFETEAKALDYMKNGIPAYVTPYIYDLDKANEQDIAISEEKYYEQLAAREAELEREFEEPEEDYEMEII